METLVLALAWTAWCVLHSVLALPRVAQWLGGQPGGRRYRLAYNAFALLTVVPLLAATRAVDSPQLWRWTGWWRAVPAAMGGAGLLLFAAGARRYDLRQFLGLGARAGAGIAAQGRLDTGGVLGVVRHPWYLGGLLLIWARDLRSADAAVNLVLSAYLAVGAALEERRLVRAFGEPYRDYQRRVPMLLPVRWRPWARRRAPGATRGPR